MMMNDLYYMQKALALARKAYCMGEVPVGALIIGNRDGEIVSEGINSRENDKKATSHAEINAINKACEILGGYRLTDCTLYVTLEPCPMCAGAIVTAGISRVVFGAADKKNGAVISKANLFDGRFTTAPEYTAGILENECAKILTEFFKERRKNKRSITFICPETEAQLQKFRKISEKDAKNPVFIRKNGKTAGTADVYGGALTNITILKEYKFCLSENEAKKAFDEAKLKYFQKE